MKITKLLVVLSILLVTGCASMGIGSRPLSELTRNYTDDTSKFMAVDDIVFHYRDEGQGPVLVLLHGVASSLHTWDGWVERLKDRYRIIRVDLPAHGLTGPDPKVERYELGYMVDKLDKFLNKVGVNKIMLAGNSLGGYISWNYALHRPDRVEKLILIDAAGYPQDMPFIMSFAALPLIGEMSSLMMPRFIVGMNVDAAYGDDSKVSARLVKRYHDLTLRPGNRQGLIDVFRTMKEQSKNPHLGDRVKMINTPTLLLWGEEDEWVPLSTMERFREDLPNVKVITYEGVGHMPMEELPVQTARDAADFLRNHRVPGQTSAGGA